ncbi:PhoH family protein [Rhodoflexus caldus]|uniref:PhoH family protein n=1 Tax=Rhodoflexus caldus TaxID=2891236 RepID=UPI00202A37AA|nr:PhoH family protein [Rhodoflexus caldus]
MVEKVIQLEDVSLVDFFGAENSNLRHIAQAFPHTKIISRGSELRIQGNNAEIVRINELINGLLEYYNKFGKVTPDNIEAYLNEHKDEWAIRKDADETILYGVRGEAIKPRTANQRKLVEAAMNNDMVFALGPAGTGKTFLAVALAVRALKNKQVKKIVITRPAVEAGENLGFLPGDLKEKIDPYLRPVYDALEDLIPAEKLKFYQERNIIEIAPIAFMRGRTLNHAFILIDEAQNTTAMQMKMILTRLGPHSQMIITGDRSQIDLPRKQRSGLVEALKILQGIEGIGIVELHERDVVRHKLVKKIIAAYDRYEKKSDEEETD